MKPTSFLIGECSDKVCREPNCQHQVTEFHGRYYVTMGHAGFNTPANNRNGYCSQATAKAAVAKYLNKKGQN